MPSPHFLLVLLQSLTESVVPMLFSSEDSEISLSQVWLQAEILQVNPDVPDPDRWEAFKGSEASGRQSLRISDPGTVIFFEDEVPEAYIGVHRRRVQFPFRKILEAWMIRWPRVVLGSLLACTDPLSTSTSSRWNLVRTAGSSLWPRQVPLQLAQGLRAELRRALQLPLLHACGGPRGAQHRVEPAPGHPLEAADGPHAGAGLLLGRGQGLESAGSAGQVQPRAGKHIILRDDLGAMWGSLYRPRASESA